jgi:hypothetical protein
MTFEFLMMILDFRISSMTIAHRVNRGGSWNNNPRNCRSANRNGNTPDNRNNNLGFRLALVPAQRPDGFQIVEPEDIPVLESLTVQDKTKYE